MIHPDPWTSLRVRDIVRHVERRHGHRTWSGAVVLGSRTLGTAEGTGEPPSDRADLEPLVERLRSLRSTIEDLRAGAEIRRFFPLLDGRTWLGEPGPVLIRAGGTLRVGAPVLLVRVDEEDRFLAFSPANDLFYEPLPGDLTEDATLVPRLEAEWADRWNPLATDPLTWEGDPWRAANIAKAGALRTDLERLLEDCSIAGGHDSLSLSVVRNIFGVVTVTVRERRWKQRVPVAEDIVLAAVGVDRLVDLFGVFHQGSATNVMARSEALFGSAHVIFGPVVTAPSSIEIAAARKRLLRWVSSDALPATMP